VGCQQNRRSARINLPPEAVGGVWGICLQPPTNPVINKLIHTYPHLSTPYPQVGGIGLGRTFQYLVVLKPYFLDCCLIRLVNSVTWL
jgi:hypothetical protein